MTSHVDAPHTENALHQEDTGASSLAALQSEHATADVPRDASEGEKAQEHAPAEEAAAAPSEAGSDDSGVQPRGLSRLLRLTILFLVANIAVIDVCIVGSLVTVLASGSGGSLAEKTGSLLFTPNVMRAFNNKQNGEFAVNQPDHSEGSTNNFSPFSDQSPFEDGNDTESDSESPASPPGPSGRHSPLQPTGSPRSGHQESPKSPTEPAQPAGSDTQLQSTGSQELADQTLNLQEIEELAITEPLERLAGPIELTEKQLLSKDFVQKLNEYFNEYTKIRDNSDTSTDFETCGNQLNDLVSRIQTLLAEKNSVESQPAEDGKEDIAGSDDLTRLKEHLRQLLDKTQTIKNLDSDIETAAAEFNELGQQFSNKANVLKAVLNQVPSEGDEYIKKRDEVKLKMTSTKIYWSYLISKKEFLNVVLKLQENIKLIEEVESKLKSNANESATPSATPSASLSDNKNEPIPPISNVETTEKKNVSATTPPSQIETPKVLPTAEQ